VKLTGLKRADITGRKVSELSAITDLPGYGWLMDPARTALESGKSVTKQFMNRSGSHISISAYQPMQGYYMTPKLSDFLS